jgi:hypothetical protein
LEKNKREDVYAGKIGRWQTVLALPLLSRTSNKKEQQKKNGENVVIFI